MFDNEAISWHRIRVAYEHGARSYVGVGPGVRHMALGGGNWGALWSFYLASFPDLFSASNQTLVADSQWKATYISCRHNKFLGGVATEGTNHVLSLGVGGGGGHLRLHFNESLLVQVSCLFKSSAVDSQIQWLISLPTQFKSNQVRQLPVAPSVNIVALNKSSWITTQ